MASNSVCSGIMSKQNIKCGDDIVAFLIVPSLIRNYFLKQGSRTFCSNYNEQILYKPISFPIFCKADEWGFISSVEKTQHVLDIEKTLKMSIEDLVQNIGELSEQKFNSISVCYEHRYIYDQMIEHAVLDSHTESSFNSHLIYPTFLEYFGFVKIGENFNENYCLQYKHKDFPEYLVKSDGAFVNVLFNGKKVENVYGVKKFCELFNIDLKIFNSQKVFNFFGEQARAYYKILSENNYLDIKNEDAKKIIIQKFNQEFVLRMHNFVIEISENFSSSLYNKNIFEYSDKEILDSRNFCYAMYKTNSFWMPTFSCYDDYGGKSFSEKLLSITKPV